MKILIADDEKMVRVSLRHMIEDMSIPSLSILEVKNGLDMIDVVKDNQPEVAFVDIKMPKMDGLAAIKEVQKLSPHTAWVILTGYSEFDYAKEAVKLGAVSYLLKPAGPEELEEVMETILEKQLNYKKLMNKNFERDIKCYYDQFYNLKDRNSCRPVDKDPSYFGITFVENSHVKEEKKSFIWQHIYRELLSLSENYLHKGIHYSISYLCHGDLTLIFTCHNTCTNDHTAMEYITELTKIASSSNSRKFKIVPIVIGKMVTLATLFESMNTLYTYLPLLMTIKTSPFISLEDLKSLAKNQKLFKLCTIIKELGHHYQAKHLVNYKSSLEEFEQVIREDCPSYSLHSIHNICSYIQTTMDCELQECSSFNEIVDQLKTYNPTMTNDRKPVKNLVNQVCEYVENNYMNDIGIATIAEMLEVTPNYLSTLFHTKKGIKFIDYLTDIRMLNARRLFMENPHLSVKDVAKSVGYYSSRHFTKLFLKSTGSYPSEYAKQELLKKQ